MRKKILVADDDPAIVEAISLILEEFGYTVNSTTDGETTNIIKRDIPDLLLLDVWMSGQDGREICKYLKQNPETKHVPIILISASHDMKPSAKMSGADDFIAKPFEMDELLMKVEKWTK